MVILFALLLLVFGLFSFFYKTSINDNIYNELESIKKNYLLNQYPTSNDYFIAKILHYDEQSQTYRYMVLEGNESFDSQKIHSIIGYALKQDFLFGHFDKQTCYLFSVKDSIIVCSDISSSLSAYHKLLVDLTISLLIVYAILFFITILVASKVFQPIKESFYRQRKFISDASHELKTPIAVISANADVLGAQQEKPSEHLNNIKSQTERMKFLVSDMLVLSRMEEEKPKLYKNHFSVSDEMLKIILPFDAVAYENKKTLAFNIQPEVNYVGDEESLKKILSILLDNAVKHSIVNSTIEVIMKKDGNKIVITVFNKGSAVHDQDSNKVFERFFRADISRSRDTGGCGLGLSIAKTIADLNKWKLTAKSKYNESMTITLIL